jgi:hypothetical protein
MVPFSHLFSCPDQRIVCIQKICETVFIKKEKKTANSTVINEKELFDGKMGALEKTKIG